MYAVTDGFSGLNGSWQTPGTGMNFLMHNMVSHCAADGAARTCLGCVFVAFLGTALGTAMF